MTQEIKLMSQTRDKKENVKKLRVLGFIPACLYGPGSANEIIKIKRSDFEKVFATAGESHLIDLSIGEAKPIKVIIKDIQRHPVKNSFVHIDFYKVDMAKKITTEIPLHFVGESKAVKELGGILVKDIDRVEVKCLAKDLVDFIEVDLTILKNLHDSIRMSELKLPAGMEFVSHTDENVVGVIEQKAEKVEEPVVKAEEAVEPAADAKAGAAAAGAAGAKTDVKAPAKPAGGKK